MLVGYLGDDIYYVDDARDRVVEAANEGSDSVVTSVSYVLAPDAWVEFLRTSDSNSMVAISLTASNTGVNLVGNAGNNILRGGTGRDVMEGGLGDDIYFVQNAEDSVIEYFRGGIDTVRTSGSYSLGLRDEIEFLILIPGEMPIGASLKGSEYSNTIIGGDGDDIIIGLAGNDTLVGGGGNDTLIGGTIESFAWRSTLPGVDLMEGGLGDDIYYVSSLFDRVVEAVGGGFDRLYAIHSYHLDPTIEIEFLAAEYPANNRAIDLSGSDGVNTVVGNDGDNILNGRGGDDALIGRAGDDELIGGAGADYMDGGSGNDIYYVDNVADRVVDGSDGGLDLVYSSVSIDLGGTHVEAIVADGIDHVTAINLAGGDIVNYIVGNAGANILIGRGGDDTLVALGGNDTVIGGTGADYLDGGAGNDTYYIDAARDLVIEHLGNGFDRVYSSISYDFGGVQEIEVIAAEDAAGAVAIDLGGANNANTIHGNAGANTLVGRGGDDVLVGNAGNDVLIGGTGADTMDGGAGNDQFYVDSAADSVTERAGGGIDTVYTSVSYTLHPDAEIEGLLTETPASTAAIDLTGNGFANMIVGNAGANAIDGKGGADVLVGGAGADRFAFTTALGGDNIDRVRDFVVGEDRFILDSAVFAGLARGTLASAAFVVGNGAPSSTPTVIYQASTGILWYDADGRGGAAAVQFATLDAGLALTEASFVVI